MKRTLNITALLFIALPGCKSFSCTALEVNYYATPSAEKPAVRVAVPADTLTPVVEVDEPQGEPDPFWFMEKPQ